MHARQSDFSIPRVVCGLVFACVAVLLSGCAESVKDIRTEGIEQFRARQYTESMATLRYALRKDPNDAEANYYMGLNYRALAERRLQAGDLPAAKRTLDNAILYFTQAIKTWPNYMAAIQAKNEALESRGKFDAALAVAEKQAENNRGIADHFIYLGDEYRERADFDNALRAYKTALAIDPNNSRAYASMGKLYERAGSQDLALDAFRRANELKAAENATAKSGAAAPSAVSQAEVASPSPQPMAPQEPAPTPRTRIYGSK
ncbi:MAG TPA: tetratricopeptide repeat protein [Phycisphaerae bacterium]|nr:tetratricopeptide repeat protein [Phycisphaerae bacterium]HOJ74993.1 tetratricopeptide repeat protein [Phycisphaerae bacterium]HOM51554.1 tetratricopeptide repeat protein [Phycisphaerae bacterium]HON67804.1 tetratricopeptide repeat protein [Phycisphaerae bacterium]HOQ85466.1 tetratricopeptide repeat protein [Phycisphaerae bacterium]